MPMPIHCEARVLHRDMLAADTYRLVLEVPSTFPKTRPGQFVFLKASEGWEPLLRRPMSVFRLRRTEHCVELEILYRVVGRGTSFLAERRVGQAIDMIGPLGHGFPSKKGRSRVLVAGGMGAAPLVFLSDELGPEDVFVLGCRSESEFPVAFVESESRIPIHVVTEDGSRGVKGLASEAASTLAADRDWGVDFIAAGPVPMLSAMARIAEDHGVGVQVSLEARMACGVGSCMGCVVPARGPEGYLRVCKEGPVFDGHRIRWEACRDVTRSVR